MVERPGDEGAGSGWTRLIVVLVSRAYRAILLTLAAVAAAPLVAGWGSYVVASASMQPSITMGDVVVARPTASDHQVRVGRVYVFDDPARPERLLVHRVVERRDNGDLTTAGDANEVTDSTPIEESAIRAQAILLAPFVGLPVHWARTSEWGTLVAWLIFSGAAFVLAGWRLDGQRPSRPRRAQVAAATALAVGAVSAGTTGTAGAAFTDNTANASSSWRAGAWVQPYIREVLADRPFGFWLLDEPSGSPYGMDRSGFDRTAQYYDALTLGGPGGLPTNPGTSVAIQGGRVVLGPHPVGAPGAYSIEVWFRTTSTLGGYVAGFEDDRDANGWKATADRIVSLDPTGRITFGVWDNYKPGITTPRAYNDGAWHHLVVTSTPTRASTIHVDGVAVASGATAPISTYTGYWRIGQGTSGPGNQTASFPGELDNVAVYDSVLASSRVAAHWAAR